MNCKCGCKEVANNEKQYIWGHNRKGKFPSKIHKSRLSKSISETYLSKKLRKNISKRIKKYWDEVDSEEKEHRLAKMLAHPPSKISLSKGGKWHLGRKRSDKTKKRLSASLKRHWDSLSPFEKEMHIKNIFAASRMPKSKFEVRIEILIKENDLPYKFVGDGKLIIDGKCPDFKHTKKNILVEAYEERWKGGTKESSKKWKKNRKYFFKKRGYKTIFIHYKDSEKKVLKLLGVSQ